MKRILSYIVVATSLLLSCGRGNLPDTDEVQNGDILHNLIMKEVKGLWKVTHPDTKLNQAENQLIIKSIEPIHYPNVKSDNGNDYSCYLVNFSDENGFSIVSIENGFPSVLALTDSGSLQADKLNNESVTFDSEEELFLYDFIEDLISENFNHYSGSNELIKTKAWGDNYTWITDTIAHPIVHLKWGQSYPFNMYMPVSYDEDHGASSPYRNRNAVGCVTTAAMQIAVSTEHPYYFNINNDIVDAYYFSDISYYGNYALFKYNNYDTLVGNYLKSKTEVLAYLLADFADAINSSYNDDGSTTAYDLVAMNYLDYLDHERYGAIDVVYCNNGISNASLICSMIDEGKPILISGRRQIDTTTIGHTWILDGYLNQHAIGLDDDTYFRQLFHFNWGWQGKYDGYYKNTNVSSRVLRDESYDPDASSTSGISRNYNISVKYYTY